MWPQLLSFLSALGIEWRLLSLHSLKRPSRLTLFAPRSLYTPSQPRYSLVLKWLVFLTHELFILFIPTPKLTPCLAPRKSPSSFFNEFLFIFLGMAQSSSCLKHFFWHPLSVPQKDKVLFLYHLEEIYQWSHRA